MILIGINRRGAQTSLASCTPRIAAMGAEKGCSVRVQTRIPGMPAELPWRTAGSEPAQLHEDMNSVVHMS